MIRKKRSYGLGVEMDIILYNHQCTLCMHSIHIRTAKTFWMWLTQIVCTRIRPSCVSLRIIFITSFAFISSDMNEWETRFRTHPATSCVSKNERNKKNSINMKDEVDAHNDDATNKKWRWLKSLVRSAMQSNRIDFHSKEYHAPHQR